MIKCLLTEAVLALTVSIGALAQNHSGFPVDIIADRAPQPLMEVELYRSRIIRPSTISGCGAGPPVHFHANVQSCLYSNSVTATTMAVMAMAASSTESSGADRAPDDGAHSSDRKILAANKKYSENGSLLKPHDNSNSPRVSR